jgi:hypothetical protein
MKTGHQHFSESIEKQNLWRIRFNQGQPNYGAVLENTSFLFSFCYWQAWPFLSGGIITTLTAMVTVLDCCKKFSRRGNLFKTYEGELILSSVKGNQNVPIASEKFFFTVTDENVAKKLNDLQGGGHYSTLPGEKKDRLSGAGAIYPIR